MFDTDSEIVILYYLNIFDFALILSVYRLHFPTMIACALYMMQVFPLDFVKFYKTFASLFNRVSKL